MMQIESVQVIPSRKDSLFEDTPLNGFECTITTSYDEWKSVMDRHLAVETPSTPNAWSVTRKPPEFDDVCERFAKAQKAFMTGPTAIFHDNLYMARTVAMPTEDHLFAMSNTGPLYMVLKEYVDNLEAERTVERFYTDPTTFKPMHGMWYPYKTQYRLRYGVREAK
jgi:hypothetical protein